MLSFRAVLIVSVAAAGAACHHPARTTTPPPVAAAPAPTPVATAQQQKPVSTNIAASDDLVKRCQLHFANTGEAPKFDFDHFELTTQDRSVLQQIADCVTTGPMKGHKLSLVGRADPRGTEEYNLGLGDKRANSVGKYLRNLGVADSKIASSTRGALDASGTDDGSWRTDRRVDVNLD